MWIRLWVAFSLSTNVWTQQTRTRIQQDGGSFEWGWQLTPDEGAGTVGHYYVKLPQSEQRVRYAADNSGYHGALSVNTTSHSTKFALGEKALQLNAQEVLPLPLPYSQDSNETHHLNGHLSTSQAPLEIFLLQHQYPTAIDPQGQLVQILPTAAPGNLIYTTVPYNVVTTPLFNIQTQPAPDEPKGSSTPPQEEEANEQESYSTSVVRVFKDHNCTNDEDSAEEHNINITNEQESEKKRAHNMQKSTTLYADTPKYELHNINGNFGAKEVTQRPLSYKGAVNFRVELPRGNARSERYYYTTISTPTVTQNSIDSQEDPGISRLVASTQDLISNDDLLRINHAAEKHVSTHTDDIIQPQNSRPEVYRSENYDHNQNGRITVRARIGNIVNSDIEHLGNDVHKEQILQTSANVYKFASPIIIPDTSNENYKEQIANNLVSTMVPYMQNGYQIVNVRSRENLSKKDKNSNGEIVDVTPRPVGSNYLAPITVALRLINNDTDLNSLEDHATSDSELVADTVESPQKEKTLVEIQKSVPVSITHINDVEVHEYLEEGRSNHKGPLEIAKNLYNKYMDALASSKKIQNNMNEILYKYGMKSDHSKDKSNENDSQEHLEPSENIQTEVGIKPEENISNERSELVQFYDGYGQEQKIIQPIVIEKQVPFTQFVDRFIEKQIPYPEPVEVIKEVDRPVAVLVPQEKIVERPVEVTKYVDKPYPIEVLQPYPVPIQVPYPVEQKVFIDRPIHVPYPIEKLIEKQIIHRIPVPTPVGIPYEVPVEHKVLYPIPIETPVPIPIEKPVPVEKIIHKEVPVPYPVETKVPYPVPYETKVPVPYPVEKRVPVPVEKIVDRPVTVTKIVEKPIHVQVPVPHPVPVEVRVPQPYPVDRIVEKKVPYPVEVEKIVEKKVPIKVPYAVEKIVEKIVEKPVVVTKYIDKPYPVERRVPYPVERIVEKKVPYPVHVPIEVKVPYAVEKPHYKVPYPVYEKPIAMYNHGNEQNQQQTQNILQYLKLNDHLRQQQKMQEQNIKIQQQQENTKQIQQYIQENQKQIQQQQQQNTKQLQYIQDNQKRIQQQHLANSPKSPPVIQSTKWGNQYASSFQYINSTPEFQQYNNNKKSQLANYLAYVTNGQRPFYYYGPPPIKNYDDMWGKNQDYLLELKVRRTDRTPKVTNLRIEYGGFKPPLIPSTEVDLDGMPVNKHEER